MFHTCSRRVDPANRNCAGIDFSYPYPLGEHRSEKALELKMIQVKAINVAETLTRLICWSVRLVVGRSAANPRSVRFVKIKKAVPTECRTLGRLIITGITIGLLCGCAATGKKVGPEQISRIEVGRSMRADVLAVLGLPNKSELTVDAGGASLEVWTYFAGPEFETASTPVYVVPSGALGGTIFYSNSQSRGEIATIIVFDADGRVLNIKAKGEPQ